MTLFALTNLSQFSLAALGAIEEQKNRDRDGGVEDGAVELVQPKHGVAGKAEKVALAVSLTLCAPFALIIFQLVSGIRIFATAFAIKGAILIALSSFAAVIALAATGDARVVLRGGISGRSRIARHLWRMCVGLTLATGSAFTNGFARFLPGPYHVPLLFFLPQFIPLILLAYWMTRTWRAGERADMVIAPK